MLGIERAAPRGKHFDCTDGAGKRYYGDKEGKEEARQRILEA